MKKIAVLRSLLLCLALLASCGVQQIMGDIAGKLADANEENETAQVQPQAQENASPAAAGEAQTAPGSAQEAPAETGGANASSPADSQPAGDEAWEVDNEGELVDESVLGPGPVQAADPEPQSDPFDFTAMSADECVTMSDGLPHITLDCEGARSINEEIESLFRSLVGTDSCSLSIEYYKNAGRILSLLVGQLHADGSAYFTPFNLDLATGQRLSGDGLLAILGADPTGLADAEIQLLGEEFEYEFGGMQEENPALYEEQYQRTISPDNVDTQRIWLGDGGRLNFVGKIFSMYDTEYIEFPMDSGLRY